MIKKYAALLLSLLLLSSCARPLPPAETTSLSAPAESTALETQAFSQASYDAGYAQGHADALLEAAETAPTVPDPSLAYQQGYDAGFADAQAASTQPPLSPAEEAGFVSVSEVIPDVILEIRYYSTYNFAGHRIDGYEAPVALMTREAAQALKAVSEDLMAQGFRLKIYDAYRPQQAVDHFARWAADLEDTRMQPFFYPEEQKEFLFDHGYIAHYSGHSRGSTVDLTLFDMETGKDADMGGTFDWFGVRSHSDFTDLTAEQLENRQILYDAMVRHGFHGITSEWWHFTLDNEPYPDTYFDFPVA